MEMNKYLLCKMLALIRLMHRDMVKFEWNTEYEIWIKYNNFHAMIWIRHRSLQTGGHFVSVSICWYMYNYVDKGQNLQIIYDRLGSS